MTGKSSTRKGVEFCSISLNTPLNGNGAEMSL